MKKAGTERSDPTLAKPLRVLATSGKDNHLECLQTNRKLTGHIIRFWDNFIFSLGPLNLAPSYGPKDMPYWDSNSAAIRDHDALHG